MHKKDHLKQLIELGQTRQQEIQASLRKHQEELDEIKRKEARPVSNAVRSLRDKLKYNPGSFKVRQELTTQALKEEQGSFIAWRGGVGAPPEAEYIEIEQPIFNSENVLDNPPMVKQHYHVLAVLDHIDDLKGLLDVVQPDCMITLPQNDLHYFSEFQIEAPRLEGNPETATAPKGAIGGRYDGILERVYQPLYDTNTVATSGTAQLNYFQTPLGGTSGGSVVPKTQCQTNMDQGGSLPYPKQFKITGISVVPDASSSYEDVAKVLDGSWFRLFIGTRDYYVSPTLPLAFAPGKRSPGVSFRLNNPLRPIYCFPEPIDLIPQQNFRVELNFPTPPRLENTVSIRIILHGYFFREVMKGGMFSSVLNSVVDSAVKGVKLDLYNQQRLGSFDAELEVEQ